MTPFTIDALREAIHSHTPRRLRPSDFPGYQHASVLIPIVPTGSELSFILTVRTEDVETHKGQISFPGGVAESADRDDIATALREAHEEIGLQPASVEVLGTMDEYPVPSGYTIAPVVGFLPAMPRLIPQAGEVAEVFTVPVGFFADAGNGRTEMRELGGKPVEVWYYQHGPHLIWGATAAMIRGLLHIVDRASPRSSR